MTVLTKLPTKIPMDRPSMIDSLLEAANSDEPSFHLQNLRDSIKNRQETGEEATFGEMQEHLRLEKWMDARKRSKKREHKYYKSEKRVLFATIATSLSGFFILGAISFLVYNFYLGQELTEIAKFFTCGPMMLMAFCTIGMAHLEKEVRDYDPFKIQHWDSMKVSEMQQRQLELIDYYQYQILPMEEEIASFRIRLDVVTLFAFKEWILYLLLRTCHSIYYLSYFYWSDKEKKSFYSMETILFGMLLVAGSMGFFGYRHNAERRKRSAKKFPSKVAHY